MARPKARKSSVVAVWHPEAEIGLAGLAQVSMEVQRGVLHRQMGIVHRLRPGAIAHGLLADGLRQVRVAGQVIRDLPEVHGHLAGGEDAQSACAMEVTMNSVVVNQWLSITSTVS